MNGCNMFIYCENNPVNRSDSNGMFWKKTGNFFKRVCMTVADFAKVTFGAGATVVNVAKQETELSPPGLNLFVTVKKGIKESQIVFSKGNSSKPISVYAQGRSDNMLLSSVGLKINTKNYTFNFSLGLDNIGVSGSVRKGDTTDAFGVSVDLSQIKVGLERSTTVKWDENIDVTTYTNVSVTGWGIGAVYLFVTTGQWYPSVQSAY